MLVSSRSGFTLIELLVVVSIIAMLASLILPSLERARERANEVVCTSNQRQIYLEATLFTQDNQEKYPEKTETWEALSVMPKLLQCPTKGELSRAFVFSGFVAGKSLGSVTDPSYEILTTDGKSENPKKNVSPPPLLTLPSDVDYRHAAGTGALASYCDGHVELVKELPPMWLLDMPSCYGGSIREHYGYFFEFDHETIISSYPSLAFFYPNDGSSQAAYCDRLKPVIRDIAKAYRLHVRVVMVDGTQLPNLATRFAIDPSSPENGYPALLFFANHELRYTLSGNPPDTTTWTETDWAQDLALVKQQITDRLDTLANQ